MNKPNYVKYLGIIESKKYIDFIEKNIEFSTNNDYNREKYFSECKNFFLVEGTKINDVNLVKKFFEISNDITKLLDLNYGNGTIYNVQFSLIPPNKKIKIHYDSGLHFSLSHRIHLPIITNEKVLFFIGDQEFNFKTNQLVEINNKKGHYVENNSTKSRIHLIIDYTPFRYAKYLT